MGRIAGRIPGVSDSADSEMIGEEDQCRESEGRGGDQLSAVGHDSQVYAILGINRGSDEEVRGSDSHGVKA